MLKARHFYIKGRVQGVAFRYFTQRIAGNFGILGWVRNLPDGRVEVFAQGEEDRLKAFTDLISKGPSAARVDNITINEMAPDESIDDFAIRF